MELTTPNEMLRHLCITVHREGKIFHNPLCCIESSLLIVMLQCMYKNNNFFKKSFLLLLFIYSFSFFPTVFNYNLLLLYHWVMW